MMKRSLNQFGVLKLNRETVRRLDVARQEVPAAPGMRPTEKDTRSQCPVSTQTKVTAHCC